MPRRPAAGPVITGLAILFVAAAQPGSASSPRWRKTLIDPVFRSEGVAIADVDRNGRVDVLVGDFWYEAPHWQPHEIRKPGVYDAAGGYSEAFLVFADDVDRDGWTDQLVVGFPGAPARWYRNPGRGTQGRWEAFPITESACNESPAYLDLDGDGRAELISPFREEQMAFYRPGDDPRTGFRQTLAGRPKQGGIQRFSHGLGAGDVDGDGRADILCKDGFYRAPAEPSGEWIYVPAALGPDCAQMHVWDLDGDGDRDVISSSAHNIGVWWHEQVSGGTQPQFRRHVIDSTFSQSHALAMADVNGDGQPDFVTGKRWWAHGPTGDVNPGDPAVLVWYEYRIAAGKLIWTRHAIDNDSGVGTQFTVADVNGDRRPDVVVSNKKGVYLFEQLPPP